MTNLYTIPSKEQLDYIEAKTPAHMFRSKVPYAVVYENLLTVQQCEVIVEELDKQEAYEFDHCNAVTRECDRPLPPVLSPIENIARWTNRDYFNYDIAMNPDAWMQTYEKGGDYQTHMDGAPGQTRKLTAVALLTDENRYGRGDLILSPTGWGGDMYVPRTQGTVVVFPFWMPHRVEAIEWGTRKSINMGFYGPPFR